MNLLAFNLGFRRLRSILRAAGFDFKQKGSHFGLGDHSLVVAIVLLPAFKTVAIIAAFGPWSATFGAWPEQVQRRAIGHIAALGNRISLAQSARANV